MPASQFLGRVCNRRRWCSAQQFWGGLEAVHSPNYQAQLLSRDLHRPSMLRVGGHLLAGLSAAAAAFVVGLGAAKSNAQSGGRGVIQQPCRLTFCTRLS